MDILANDWDEQIANLRVSLLDTTKNGNVSIVANKLEYIADTDFEGLDTCSYLICDRYVYCDTGYVYLKIQNVVGVSEISISSISFYPNPTNGIVKIAGLSNEISALRVLNIRGEAIEIPLNTENEFDLSDASNGVYFISISTAHKTITKRIIKQ